jgi:uncharacterized protein (DUF2236 family)
MQPGPYGLQQKVLSAETAMGCQPATQPAHNTRAAAYPGGNTDLQDGLQMLLVAAACIMLQQVLLRAVQQHAAHCPSSCSISFAVQKHSS